MLRLFKSLKDRLAYYFSSGKADGRGEKVLDNPLPSPNLGGRDESKGSSFWDGFSEKGKRGEYINTHHPVFQQGRYLYDAQVLHADAQMWKEGHPDYQKSAITPERVMLVARRYCQLINALGQLRADYSTLRDIVEGKITRTESGDYYKG